jgi:hypothetical protein
MWLLYKRCLPSRNTCVFLIFTISYPTITSLIYSSHFSFFFNLVCEAIGTAATPGLLCQAVVIVRMIVEKEMECRLARQTEVLGENLPQRHFCPSQNPTWPDPGLNPGCRGGKPATNRLSYGGLRSSYAHTFTVSFIQKQYQKKLFYVHLNFTGCVCPYMQL